MLTCFEWTREFKGAIKVDSWSGSELQQSLDLIIQFCLIFYQVKYSSSSIVDIQIF